MHENQDPGFYSMDDETPGDETKDTPEKGRRLYVYRINEAVVVGFDLASAVRDYLAAIEAGEVQGSVHIHEASAGELPVILSMELAIEIVAEKSKG